MRVFLHGGGAFDLTAQGAVSVDFGAVFTHLARINRFNGATSRPVSVLEHSLAVASILPDHLRLAGLLHDAHEALIGDIAVPVQEMLEADLPGFGRSLQALRDRLDLVIALAAVRLAAPIAPPAQALVLARLFAGGSVLSADLAAREMEIALFIRGEDRRADYRVLPELYQRAAPGERGMVEGACVLLERLAARDYGLRREVDLS
jgi:hypothetical protein